MSGIKPISHYFKVLAKDEREVEDLLSTHLSRKSQTASHLSRKSQTASILPAKSISTVSTKVLDIIDLLIIYSLAIYIQLESAWISPNPHKMKVFF